MLAKNSQAPRSFRKHALSLTFFASKLAPTKGDARLTDWHCGKPARHSSLLATQFGRLIKILILINQ
ncbi:hypothetical protein C1Y18_03005 [Pseudomonas sp. MPR-R5A]|nr:hypothetical protein C1Y25_05295 [Pseudomonas sp. MPBC4-3]PMX27159.1 hypothetical protein C1Y23_10530 [Pseudomonas sp. GW460-12]PMX35179.1 hypothetical protein C1Y24_10775 [Pseudomonas sp. MPR-R2A4]PMX40696.1 hypothetical protein C1Y26_13515 [Pseudomonas sp. MPR-R2A7]PMX49928.1 hypothetical protein C1Y20_05170 [Pseudomonas sp. FW301-21B01]PMX91040.1 hypothetical protein C1Y21_13145 [Pseudomonas sp. MPR-R2A3]PMY10601.1 hypothetical protein C1Y18_03005 [Pseudomonas sp. MPR-R5A]PMY13568.1 hy